MSSLTVTDKRALELFLEMGAGFVLDFHNGTFHDFMVDHAGVDIMAPEYQDGGTSKANRLRTFWKKSDDAKTGRVLLALIEHGVSYAPNKAQAAEKCRPIAQRLLGATASGLSELKVAAVKWDMPHLQKEVERARASIETDPGLAIGTAKEILETICKTILSERGIPLPDNTEFQPLATEVRKALPLVPDDMEESSVKKLLGQLAGLTGSIAELRNDHGSGHGRHGQTQPLTQRHARLAVGAAATVAVFFLETHLETKTSATSPTF